MKLASPCGRINQIRRDRPLTNEELMAHVPSVLNQSNMVQKLPVDIYVSNHKNSSALSTSGKKRGGIGLLLLIKPARNRRPVSV